MFDALKEHTITILSIFGSREIWHFFSLGIVLMSLINTLTLGVC